MISYIKTVFTKPKEIYTGRNMRNSHYFLLLLLMTLVLTLLSIFEFIPGARTVNNDLDEIRNSIPEFELVDNQLDSESESYVYQTDTMRFYFDPDDRMEVENINDDMTTTSAPISVGLLDDQIHLSALGQEYSINYADFDNLTTEDLESLINNFGNVSTEMVLLFLVFLFIFNLFLFISQLLPITIFANLISVTRRTPLRFFQSAKISLLATMAPMLIIYVINAFFFTVSFQLEITFIASLVLYYMSITEMKKRISNQTEDSSNDDSE